MFSPYYDDHNPPVSNGPDTEGGEFSIDIASTIDILQLHTAVQACFRDELQDQGEFFRWLEIASVVFFTSYKNADESIKEKRTSGLQKDYREFETHGTIIMRHFSKV